MSSLPTITHGRPSPGLPPNVIDLSDSIPLSTPCTPAGLGCNALLAELTPAQAAHRTLPPTTITDMQRALASNDLECLTHLANSIQACCTADHLTPIPGPDGLPLFIETVALF